MKDDSIREAIHSLIRFIGDDPDREGLRETPDRIIRSYAEIFAGYKDDPAKIFKTFDGENYDEMIVLSNVEFTSWCEHHILPFTGVAHIGYIPTNGRIVGLSKLARLLDCYSKRLQVQERLTDQITQAITKYLAPLGAACVIEATHMCMTCRGAKKRDARMITSSLAGRFRVPEVRQEFFNLIR